MDAKLKTTLAAEDTAEDNGLPANDRTTCHTCQTWGTPEHRDSAEHKAAIGIHPDFVYNEQAGMYQSPSRGRGRPPKGGKRVHVILDTGRLRAVDELWAYALMGDPKATRTQVIEALIDKALSR